MSDYIELLIQADTLDTRWVAVAPNEHALGFHAGFTRDDAEAGWRQAWAIPAKGMTEADIRGRLTDLRNSSEAYWHDLLSEHVSDRVVLTGNHFVMHGLGGPGFDGATFRVHWIDQARAPVVCSLSGQGSVPAWIRPRMPDNAARIEDLDDRCATFAWQD